MILSPDTFERVKKHLLIAGNGEKFRYLWNYAVEMRVKADHGLQHQTETCRLILNQVEMRVEADHGLQPPKNSHVLSQSDSKPTLALKVARIAS